jgi:hypothetical protein
MCNTVSVGGGAKGPSKNREQRIPIKPSLEKGSHSCRTTVDNNPQSVIQYITHKFGAEFEVLVNDSNNKPSHGVMWLITGWRADECCWRNSEFSDPEMYHAELRGTVKTVGVRSLLFPDIIEKGDFRSYALRLGKHEHFLMFRDRYCTINSNGISNSSFYVHYNINWEKLRNEFGGIQFSYNYRKSRVFNHIDIASICIWRPEALGCIQVWQSREKGGEFIEYPDGVALNFYNSPTNLEDYFRKKDNTIRRNEPPNYWELQNRPRIPEAKVTVDESKQDDSHLTPDSSIVPTTTLDQINENSDPPNNNEKNKPKNPNLNNRQQNRHRNNRKPTCQIL